MRIVRGFIPGEHAPGLVPDSALPDENEVMIVGRHKRSLAVVADETYARVSAQDPRGQLVELYEGVSKLAGSGSVVRPLRSDHVPTVEVEPTSPEDYRRLSPETGLLPLLALESERIPDSAAILDFLDERFPDPPLVSGDALTV